MNEANKFELSVHYLGVTRDSREVHLDGIEIFLYKEQVYMKTDFDLEGKLRNQITN